MFNREMMAVTLSLSCSMLCHADTDPVDIVSGLAVARCISVISTKNSVAGVVWNISPPHIVSFYMHRPTGLSIPV